jgi:hypothetical protein
MGKQYLELYGSLFLPAGVIVLRFVLDILLPVDLVRDAIDWEMTLLSYD